MQSTLDDEKRVVRALVRKRRRRLPGAKAEQAEQGLLRNLTTLVTERGARSVSCYLSTASEPGTRSFIEWARSSGIRIILPISREDGLLDWTRGEHGSETTGLWGISEADGELLGPTAINDVDLILAPACAVDAQGTRLGWGRGYFDKTLGALKNPPPVYAVVFDNEVLPEVPKDVHDQPVNGVVTPSRILDFSFD